MKEIGKEVVEIGGVEYTLFLNRKGVVAWEKYAKKEAEIVRELTRKAKDIEFDGEIEDNTDPFEGLDVIEELDSNDAVLTTYYQKLYWIMLYEFHKFSFEQAKAIYNQACKEYGEEQIMQLGTQMLEDANRDLEKANNQAQLKNLKALRPTK